MPSPPPHIIFLARPALPALPCLYLSSFSLSLSFSLALSDNNNINDNLLFFIRLQHSDVFDQTQHLTKDYLTLHQESPPHTTPLRPTTPLSTTPPHYKHHEQHQGQDEEEVEPQGRERYSSTTPPTSMSFHNHANNPPPPPPPPYFFQASSQLTPATHLSQHRRALGPRRS